MSKASFHRYFEMFKECAEMIMEAKFFEAVITQCHEFFRIFTRML